MAQYLTKAQLEDLFYKATLDITGFTAQSIRFSYQPNSAPFFEQGQDGVYIYVSPMESDVGKFRDITYGELPGNVSVEESIVYTRVIQCQWTCYGPNAYDTAVTIRDGILSESVRRTFSRSRVYPNPRIQTPIRTPESVNSQWWERADIKVLFNVGTEKTAPIPTMSGAVIRLHNEDGLQRTINILNQ